jgi:hypothetical protein
VPGATLIVSPAEAAATAAAMVVLQSPPAALTQMVAAEAALASENNERATEMCLELIMFSFSPSEVVGELLQGAYILAAIRRDGVL